MMNMMAHVSNGVKLLFSSLAHGGPNIAPTARDLLCSLLLYTSCNWSPRDLFRSPSVRYFKRNIDECKKTLSPCRHFLLIFCDKESCRGLSCESQCFRTPSTTANWLLCRARIFLTGDRDTHRPILLPTDVTVPGSHRRFDGALATPARCNLLEERQDHVADHMNRVASVDDGEDLLTLPAIPLLTASGRELRKLLCGIADGCLVDLVPRLSLRS